MLDGNTEERRPAMFESTLSAQGLSEGERRLGPLSAAVLGHLVLVSVIVGVTALIVPPIVGPELQQAPGFVRVLLPPDLGPPRSAAPQPKMGTDTAAPKRTIAPPPPVPSPVPPIATPETPIPTDDPPALEGPDGPGEGQPGLRDGTGSDPFGTGGEGEDGGGGGGGGGASPVPFSAEMVRPVLLSKVEPAYPEVARKVRLDGRVTVQAVIGLDGSVESAEILASTSPLFNEAARSAVLNWRYRPALMDGKPVRIYFTVVVDFSIR